MRSSKSRTDQPSSTQTNEDTVNDPSARETRLSRQSFDEYKIPLPPIVEVENITQFAHTVGIAGLYSHSLGEGGLAALADGSYRIVFDALDAARFYAQSNLTSEVVGSVVRLSYSDPELGFEIEIDPSSRISLTRQGSSLRRFHDWYRSFALGFHGSVLTPVLDLLRRLGQLSSQLPDSPGHQIAITRVDFKFTLILHDVHFPSSPTNSSAPPNLTAMQRLIHVVPAANGSFIGSEQLGTPISHDGMAGHVPDMGRVDYLVNRATTIADVDSSEDAVTAFEHYKVEAPSNNSWGTLWVNFGVSGHSSESDTGDREHFDGGAFLRPATYSYVYREFFRDKALGQFLASLMEGGTFRVTTGYVP